MEFLIIIAFCASIVAVLALLAQVLSTRRELKRMIEVAKSNAWEDSYRRRRPLDSRRSIL